MNIMSDYKQQAIEALRSIAEQPYDAELRTDAMPDLSGVIFRIFDKRTGNKIAGIQMTTLEIDGVIADLIKMRKSLSI